jgi:glucose-1-phosphate adenylyltransferase
VVIEPGARVGVDPEADRKRFTISAGGVVVIPKGERVTAASS